MKSKVIIVQIIFLIILGCKSQNINQEKGVPKHLLNWIDGINTHDSNTIKNLYDSKSVKIISPDNFIESSNGIANYYKTKKEKIISIESLFSSEASNKRKINYEIVNYKTNKRKNFIELVIWKIENDKIIREFEFTKESNLNSKVIDTTKINERRKLWIELCNQNNSNNLVRELYSKNSIYYNHKPIIKGTEKLIKEYSYMDNKNYHLKLEPLIVKPVNKNLVFEIGQCAGSYNGKYILVWEKDVNGIWKIIIDSNI
ncbi:hypothetical protein ACTS9U_04630 [Empedobacter falsenii]|uniref:hypothetical protein n=1 Tax=Empedobacter sp. UBA5987 TaxID=1946444 RepID=UPI0025BAA2AB|nr:hypothetical protein [Empedobacter sp. UBA5987]